MYAVVVAVIVMASLHAILGLISVSLGVTSSIRAEVWLAHSVSPIWSGGFFLMTGILGFACAKRKTAYLILCFTAFSIVSLVVAIVSIQLLRLGLVNHTTDGHTFQKESKDILLLVALGGAGFECVICIVSSFVSCRMAKAVKKELFKKREGTFHVQEEDSQVADQAQDEVAQDGNLYPQFGCINQALQINEKPVSGDHIQIYVQDENGAEISPKIDGQKIIKSQRTSNHTDV